MVSFAKKASNIREDLKKSSGGNAGWLRGIKDGKDLRVRFLQDPEEWLEYGEHYARSTGFFPCTGDETCGGCASDDDRMAKPSTKYIAQVLIQHEDGAKDVGQVRALKIPRTLANKLTIRAERSGNTLLDRDYTILRRGSGTDTEYDVEREDKAPMDLSKYTHVDVDAILSQQFDENAPPLVGVLPKQIKGSDDEPAKATGIREQLKAAAAENKANGVVAEDEPPF